MKVTVECPECRAAFRAAEEHVGRRAKCPSCREVIRVPGAAGASKAPARPASPAPPPQSEPEEETYALAGGPAAGAVARKVAASRAGAGKAATEAAPTRPTRTPIQILAAFRGEIRPVRPTLLYRTWVLLIAAIMVLLPALYLALIGLVGYGLFLYATRGLVLLQGVRLNKVTLALYVSPIVVGCAVIAFMLKPLFARPLKESKTREIDPSKEPLLMAFIDGVCSSVGAPTPARVDVDCQVNASARLESWALSPSKTLVLTIGLPLVAGLDLRQFTGVLAHEFGHFSQGAGMRLSILIRSINRWFARVVYERDEWDQSLAEASRDGHVLVMLVAGLARLAVWLSRRVLWVLMYVGHLASGFLLRQMEFDADRYEARMVGGPVFETTVDRLAELNLASNAAHNELASCWRERRLPDDLPRLIRIEAAKLPEPLREALRQATRSGRGTLFDTHPPDAARIARALAEADAGIFTLDGPATDLFRDFDGLSRSTTYHYYRSMLGREVSKEQLFPISDALLDQEVRREAGEAFDRFFLEALGPIQAIPLDSEYPAPPAVPKEAKRELVAARRSMRQAREASREALGRWGEAHTQAMLAESASILLKVGKGITPSKFGLTRATPRAAEAARDEAEGTVRAVDADLEPFGRAASARLALALGFLELDVVADRVPDGAARREEARALYPCAAALGARVMPGLAPVTRAWRVASVLAENYREGKPDDEAMINALLRGGQALHESLAELKRKAGDAISYPFEHAQQGMTLGRFVLPAVPEPRAVGDLLQAGGEAQERLFDLHRRVLGRLAATAEAVEQVLGLPPMVVEAAA